MSGPNTVFIVEEDPGVLRRVHLALAIHGFAVHSFGSTTEFLETIDDDTVGCLVTDWHLPGMNGAPLPKVLLLGRGSLAFVVVTDRADVQQAFDLVLHKVVSILERPYNDLDLVRSVSSGLRRSQELHREASRARDVRQRLQELSQQELEIMNGMIAGKPIKCVSEELGISMRTVDRRRANILRRMQVDSVGKLGVLLAEHGLASEPSSKQHFEPVTHV